MWTRLEVFVGGTWKGYYYGLLDCSDLQDTDAQILINCCLSYPPNEVYTDNQGKKNEQPLESWATPAGSLRLADNWELAIELCDEHNIPWRWLYSEDPGEPVWKDDWQGVFLPTPDREVEITEYG